MLVPLHYLLELVQIYSLEHDTVLEVKSAVFIRQEVILYNADSASACYGNLYFVTVKVDVEDIEGNERFAIIQLKLREIVRSELGEIENFGFHRGYLQFFIFAFRQGATGALGEINSCSFKIDAAEVNEIGQNYYV